MYCVIVCSSKVYHVGKIYEPFKKFWTSPSVFFGLIFVANVWASNVKLCDRDLGLGSLPRSPLRKQGENTAK